MFVDAADVAVNVGTVGRRTMTATLCTVGRTLVFERRNPGPNLSNISKRITPSFAPTCELSILYATLVSRAMRAVMLNRLSWVRYVSGQTLRDTPSVIA